MAGDSAMSLRLILREIMGDQAATEVMARPDEPFGTRLSHADRELLFYNVRRVRPDIHADAFWDPSTTAHTLEDWLQAGSDPHGKPQIQRGQYRTARVSLRDLIPPDLDQLYRIAMEPSNAHRWRYQGRSLSPEDFRATIFSKSVLCQFAVVSTSGKLAGCVTAYDADFLGGHCTVAAVGGKKHDAGPGTVAEGCGILFQYVFDHFPFHKIFLETPEYNASLLKGGVGGLANLEAEILDYYFFAGRRWSKQIYSVTRERWDILVTDHLPEWDHG